MHDELERIRLGDETALEQLLQRGWEPLVRHLEGLLGSRERAQDAAQDAFVKLWEARERWVEGSAYGLLFRIGRNNALDHLRHERVRSRKAADVVMPRSPLTPDEVLDGVECLDRVREAVASLADRRREVFELVRLAGLNYREAADVLGLSPQTVANQMSLALRDLRHLLSDVIARPRPTDAPRIGRSEDG